MKKYDRKIIEKENYRVKYVFVPQVSVNFGISHSSKLYTNFVKCVNLVIFIKFC